MKPTFLASSLLILTAGAMGADGNFERKIGPLLAEKCLDCHNSREREGGLDLSLKTAAFSGGDSGTVIVPGKLAESLLWDRISADEMPPKHPLTVDEKQSIRSWIEQGAPWDGERIDPFAYSTGKRAGYDWWSLQRLSDPVPPRTTEKQHPVDAFVQRKLVEHGLAPSPPADRRTLIRRLSFSLTGLPPTPDEVKTFSSDPSPDAYQRLVDRLLDSPHYGERWARHWLDLARFGESQGFERDKLRENAWPYRDWVIQALNADMPYDEFATKQIAGDVLQPGESESIVATGFLVAGPYDEVGQSQQSAAMRAVVRQDEMEDYIGTVCQTFLGLTVNCARCHNHKFDPISQTEYYQIAAALAGVRAGERPYQTKEDRQSLQSARDQLANVQHEIDSLLAPIREQILNERESNLSADDVPRPIARWTFETGFNDEIGQHHGTAHGAAEIVDGQLLLNGTNAYVSTSPLETSIQAKTLEAWVQLDSLTQRGGGVISVQTTDGNVFDAIVFGEREPQQWMAGSNGFVRSQPFHGPEEKQADKTLVHVAIVYDEEGTIQAYRNGEPYGRPYQSSGAETYSPGQSQVLFGLRHGTAAGGNRLLAGRIEQAQLYDRALSAAEIAASSSQFGILSRAHLLTKLTPEQRAKLEQWETQAKVLMERIRSLENRRVYAVTPRPPEATHVLLRGNPGSPVEVVQPMGIASIQGLSPDFELTPDAKEEDRRRKLADWMTSEHNPLFARVIVNRLWHYHFGTGLVASPNDFGFNGSRPTHPELLDFLAEYLIENDWSLKSVHRLIVTSETYQQSSKPRADAMATDSGNRWLWRFAPQRLEAEVIRDAMLKVTGLLNTELGGPSYRNFETFNHNSQFYTMQDREGPDFQRRTIYRMWVRSGRNQFLDAFDCPDPSVTTPDRAVTTTPTQSLSLLNNSFVLRMGDQLEARVEATDNADAGQQVRSMYDFVFQRPPRPEESEAAVAFVNQHGLSALARVLFNTNEFLFAE